MVAIAWGIALLGLEIGDAMMRVRYGWKYDGSDSVNKSVLAAVVGLIICSVIELSK